jgi:hypothetical protein
MGVRGVNASGSGYGLVASSCAYDNETSGSIKGTEFQD